MAFSHRCRRVVLCTRWQALREKTRSLREGVAASEESERGGKVGRMVNQVEWAERNREGQLGARPAHAALSQQLVEPELMLSLAVSMVPTVAPQQQAPAEEQTVRSLPRNDSVPRTGLLKPSL